MTTQQVKTVLQKLSKKNVKILSITGGEPLVREDIIEIIDYAKWQLHFPYVRLQTNGVLLNNTQIIRACILSLDDLWISVDGVGEIHDKIRGSAGTFDKVEENIRLFNKMRGQQHFPNLIINTVVTKHNSHQLSEIKQLSRKWNAQYHFFHKVANVKGSPYHTEQFSSEEDIGEEIYYWNRKGCLLLYTNIMINPEGFVVPCGILDKLPVGNLLNDDFNDVWNGRAMKEVRRMVWKGIDVCKRCCVPNTNLRSRLRSDFFNMKRILI